VPESELTTSASTVVHQASNRKIGYGELAAKAATLTPPDMETVGSGPEGLHDHRQGMPGVDNHRIVTEAALRHRRDGAGYAVRVFEKRRCSRRR
jgi:isoquinoline 1-oxidoreductase beta subunit